MNSTAGLKASKTVTHFVVRRIDRRHVARQVQWVPEASPCPLLARSRPFAPLKSMPALRCKADNSEYHYIRLPPDQLSLE